MLKKAQKNDATKQIYQKRRAELTEKLSRFSVHHRHHTAPWFLGDERMKGWTELENSFPTLSLTPPSTNAESPKNNPQTQFSVCVSVFMCLCVCFNVFLPSFFFFFSFLVWCQMFQLSNAAQHRW